MTRHTWACAALVLALGAQGSAAGAAGETTTRRASVAPDGSAGNSRSSICDVANDGAVAYDSFSSNLVEDDTNDAGDVFLYDGAGHVDRVSETSDGGQARALTEFPSITPDGRVVVFTTLGYDLMTERQGARWMSVWAHDTATGQTTRASDRSDGRRAFGHSYDHAISHDGRYVSFVSSAPNLAMKGDHNDADDVFVHDRLTRKTNRVSLSRKLGDANSDSSGTDISADGRYVAFGSYASNLVRGDDNGAMDVFVYDRLERKTERVSLTAAGKQSPTYSFNPSISADGRYVAFGSWARLARTDATGTDVYVHDRVTGKTEHVSVGDRGAANANADYPVISGDGRYVAFMSFADTLANGDTNGAPDVFVRDLVEGKTTRVSVGDEGQQANAGTTTPPGLSDDGRYVCWSSAATNLVDGPDAHPEAEDVYVRGPLF